MKSLSNHQLEREYDGFVVKTIKVVLKEVLGEKAFRKMIRVMRENYSLELDDLPEKTEAFSWVLREILGEGSTIIEDLIVENLYTSLGLVLTWKRDFSLSDYIAELPSTYRPVNQQLRR